MPRLSYKIESRPNVPIKGVPYDYDEYRIIIFGDMHDCGVGGEIYEGEWTPDRLEAYQDAMQYVKSLIDEACKLRSGILKDVGEIIVNKEARK